MKWLVQDMLPAQGLFLLKGSPKTGKTTLVKTLMASLDEGYDFLGKKTRVAYSVILEYGKYDMEKSAYYQITDLVNEDPDINLIIIDAMLPVAVPLLTAFNRAAHEHGVAVIFVTHKNKIEDTELGWFNGKWVIRRDKGKRYLQVAIDDHPGFEIKL